VELSEFLLARIAEDEEAARSEGTRTQDEGMWAYLVVRQCGAVREIIKDHAGTDRAYSHWVEDDDGGNGRFEPPDGTPACRQCTRAVDSKRVTDNWDVEPRVIYPCDTLRYLALPYAGHPDYREEWRA
jgi:hypothetical protein